MQLRRIGLVFYLLLGSAFLFSAGRAQTGISLLGTTGLLNVPTADILPDRVVCFGMHYIPKPFAVLAGPDYSNMAYYCSMGYLPFLEVSLRITRIVHWKEYTLRLGDRMASFRVRLTREKNFFPALAIGTQDMMSVIYEEGPCHFNALYIVGSKTLTLHQALKTGFHLGYGVDWMKADEHHLVGLFGGLDLRINRYITLMAEHDTEKINLGAQLNFFSHFHLILAWLNAHKWSGGMNVSCRL